MSFDRQAANRRHNKRRYKGGEWRKDPETSKHKIVKAAKRETYKFLDFGRRKERLNTSQIKRIFERRYWVVLEWGKGTRPLKGTTIAQTLTAMREHPEKRQEIVQLLLSTIKPGREYHEPL